MTGSKLTGFFTLIKNPKRKNFTINLNNDGEVLAH